MRTCSGIYLGSCGAGGSSSTRLSTLILAAIIEPIVRGRVDDCDLTRRIFKRLRGNAWFLPLSLHRPRVALFPIPKHRSFPLHGRKSLPETADRRLTLRRSLPERRGESSSNVLQERLAPKRLRMMTMMIMMLSTAMEIMMMMM